ncbi:MAG TPA: beta-propeller fold lactonase family protein [Candidatus Deferrimicrobium sp.]|nr:beta-propeller fold lactonase family protein [Candidatus Kapabacteria bacterium]HLP60897.1 beta-propeller fold lactonase family protein [Candidatus Deferrimicrobium sp.]
MKKKTLLMLCLALSLVSLATAEEPIGVFANSNTNCIQFIDPVTQTVSASLLKGNLGSYGGGLFDVVITSDGKTTIVSNFGDQMIFFIDISGGFYVKPNILGYRKIPFFAEDMALTPDDKYVLITDGGFSGWIGVVDIASRKLVYSHNFTNVYSNAISISPDGQTVLTADYSHDKINLFMLQPDGILTYVKSKNIRPHHPVNVAISPDGKTVIAVSANWFEIPVFSIIPGDLDFKGDVDLRYKTGQCCVFSSDGTKAYYLSNNPVHRAVIEVLDVTGPGQVSPTGINIPARPKKGISQLFGVDTIAIDPSGNYLYVTNPTVSGGVTRISIIDLTINAQVKYIEAGGIPTGIAFAIIKD